MAVTLNARGTSVSSFQIGKGGSTITADADGYLTIADGVSTEQPLGYNTIPIYEIDASDIFDLAHAGMMWHKDSGGAVTFTCDEVATIPQGSTWIVHNDDAEDITIAQGTGVTIAFLASGAAPATGDVTVSQGGIVTVYKYTDTEYWVWGDDGPFNILTAGATTNSTLRWDGSAWAENTSLLVSSTGSLFIGEQADAATDQAGYGQLWVDNTTPNDLYFTDDTGQDVQITNNGVLNVSGFVDTTGTPADNQIAVFTDADTIEGDASLTFSGGTLTTTTFAGALSGNATTATAWATTRTIGMSGDVTSDAVNIDGSGNITITNTVVANDSHTHDANNLTGTTLASGVVTSSLTTVGTIGTGTWQGTTVDELYGGTGFATYATGDILYASAANTLSKLAAGADGEVLALASGVPTWSAAGTGTIGGSITDNQVAVGATTANSIEGDASFTWNGSTLDVAGTVVGDAVTAGAGSPAVDGTIFLTLNGDRPWTFKQNGADGAAALELNSTVDGKNFYITDAADNIQYNFITSATSPAFEVRDALGTDFVSFSHDGTDFNIAGTNTTDLNITGVTALQAGTVDADFDAITATSYGGITEANLVDKSATESVTGAWGFSTSGALSANWFRLENQEQGTYGGGATPSDGTMYFDNNTDNADLNGTPLITGGIRGGIILHSEDGWGMVLDTNNMDDVAWGGTVDNITVADESADTTCFPLFVTAATGALQPKTGTNITFNSSTGHFTATSKSFLIEHPTKPGKKLQYGSLEGPENGVYVRGRLTDSNTIELPDYWTGLVDPNSITVNLTPIGQHQNFYVKEIGDNKVIVGGGTDCFYTVYAERIDVDKLEIEIDK